MLVEAKKLTSRTKILGIAIVIVAVTGLLLYVPLSLAGSRNNHRNEEDENHAPMVPMLPMMINDEIHEWINRARPLFQRFGGLIQELLRRLVANSTAVEIHGTVVTLVNRMLVLNTAAGQVRIHLPAKWIVGGDVLEREDLFETDYLTIGQSVTVKALKGTVIARETYIISVLLGYEIINVTSVHAYAVLPFNIETP